MKEKRRSFAIIGTGVRGAFFAESLDKRNDSEIIALCDPNEYRMNEFSKRLSAVPQCFKSVQAMLKKVKPDAVIITSPDYCHEPNAVAAIKNGANVLIDKPLATTAKGCRNIISAAEKSGRIAMMGFNLRHDPTLTRLKKLIDDGCLGRIFLIENREFYNGGRTYMARWNRNYALSGGLWVHKGSHDFDVFNWLLGFPRPVKVSAFANISVLTPENIPFEREKGKKPGPTCHECSYSKICPDVRILANVSEFSDEARKIDNYSRDTCIYLSDKDVHDNGIAMVEYENGVKASHMECFITSLDDRMYTIAGDRGIAEVSLASRRIILYPRWTKEVITYNIPEAEGGHGGADTGLIDAFVKVIKGEITVPSTLEHGLLSTAIGEAAEVSRRKGKTVYIGAL